MLCEIPHPRRPRRQRAPADGLPRRPPRRHASPAGHVVRAPELRRQSTETRHGASRGRGDATARDGTGAGVRDVSDTSGARLGSTVHSVPRLTLSSRGQLGWTAPVASVAAQSSSLRVDSADQQLRSRRTEVAAATVGGDGGGGSGGDDAGSRETS